MSLMQIILLAVTVFFAYKVYEHIQGLEEPEERGQTLPEQIDIDALVDEADRAFGAGRMLEARELLQKAYAHDDSIPELANRLGFVLSAMGNNEEALKLYLHALSLKEEDVTHLAIASQLRTLGRLDESQEHYRRAIELDDNYEVSYFNYANLLVEMGETDEAKAMYQKALEVEPELEAAKEELEKLNGQ
ncbi:MAG: tetratricopeptide repeat protein [Thiovulaceae bacterium]|nr:tetratricopeptide repeat protein [Sulfurimonadaceae bacterium]